MSSVERLYGIRQLNEMLLYKRTLRHSLDHITYVKTPHTKRDHILKLVIGKLQTTSWREVYGLDVNQTMQLEFSDFILMAEELTQHSIRVNQSTEALLQNMQPKEK